MYDNPRFLPAGDQAITVELGDSISVSTNRRVHSLTLAVEQAKVPGVFDLVPTYRSLLIYYDPLVTSEKEVQSSVEEIEAALDEQADPERRIVSLPTLYGGEYGPDLDFVAEHAGLTTDEVVTAHSSTDYLVYMIGFTPGFPYLGGLPEGLRTPRLNSPRIEVPAGSVGIAESQTGVYPFSSPGGWRLVGRTPLRLFDPDRQHPAQLSAGDYVRFVPLATEEEFLAVRDRVERDEYVVATENVP